MGSILKNCQTDNHERSLNTKNSCRCNCHHPSKINPIDVKLLTKVGITPRTFCPDCKINYDREYDFCINCNRTLIKKYTAKKIQYKDSMGKIDFLMHKKRVKESEELKQKRDEVNNIYQLGRLRARYSFGVRSRKFWDKNATEKLVHKFAMDEVHEYLGHRWNPWERRWMK
jgi:hypothetical protein